jgi:hypothetical protein
MKKLVIIFIIVVFGVCAFFGFKAAAKILPANNGITAGQQDSKQPTPILQQNFLLVHVDDLNTNDPELISAWVVFVYQSDPPQMMFVPLYPSLTVDIHDRLKRTFSLNSDNTLNSQFISQVKKSFDIQISGYILSDDVGIGYSNQWLTGQTTTPVSTYANTDEEKLAVRTAGQTVYQQFCQLLSTGASKSYFSAVNWTLLLPDHFSTDIPFETIALSTDKITNASTIQCDVFSGD